MSLRFFLLLLFMSLTTNSFAGYWQVSFSGGNHAFRTYLMGNPGITFEQTGSVPFTVNQNTCYGTSLVNSYYNQEAYVHSDGNVTATITWNNGGNPNDVAPSQVIVSEYAEASWVHYNGTPVITSDLQNEIGGSIVYSPNGQSARRFGTRTQVHEVGPDGSVTCSIQMRADFTFRDTSNLDQGTTAVAGCYYSVVVGTVEIRRDGAKITSANNKVLPGENVNLSLVITGGLASSDFVWTIPGKIFKNYTFATPQNSLAEFVENDSDLRWTSAQFRWVQGNDDERSVKCDLKVGGADVSVTAKLKVIKPVPDWRITPGFVRLRPGPNGISEAVELIGIGPGEQGIDWKGTRVDVSYGVGDYCFVQLANFSRVGSTGVTGGRPSGSRYVLPESFRSGLDLNAPYKPMGSSIGIWLTGIAIGDSGELAGDSPDQPMAAEVENPADPNNPTIVVFKHVSVSDSFTTFLMFKSHKANSCWVPLQKVEWSWKATVIDEGQLTPHYTILKNIPPTLGQRADTDVFPLWIRVVNLSTTRFIPLIGDW